ncbi:MAG: LysR substrate-binding domain-containing protein, partial [Boseongicola sp.]|nr:LysR substrate-binding domain-containing protein [Boseongicola sp.]
MTHAQIRAFHHVALLGGFSLAAEALGLTQPAISDQVLRLERDNDVLLFSRIRKKVVLTPDGEELFAKTRAYFETEGEIKGLLSETANRIEEELRIMADSASHVSSIIHGFRKTYPSVRIVIASGNTEEIVQRLRSFDADIGVIGSGESYDDFETLSLSRSKLVGFARKDYFPTGKRSISLAELADLPLVLREPGSKTRQQLEELGKERGVTLDPAVVAEGREAVREIVAANDGVGIVSRAELGEDQRIRAFELEDIDLEMRQMVVHLRTR